MDDKDKIGGTETFVPYDHITSRTRLLESISRQVQNNDDAEILVTAPVIETRVSWTQRLIRWLRQN